MTPMPAETFRQSTHQISQNCGVLIASLTMHLVPGDHLLASLTGGLTVRPPPGAGMQTIGKRRPHEKQIDRTMADKGLGDADVGRCLEISIIRNTESGEAMKAAPPKPMIAMPVAMPGRSGNHLIRVDTGEM